MSRPPRLILPKLVDPSSPPPPPKEAESSRKRENVPIACQKCRARKVKCDGQRPSCTPCRTRNLPCEYKDSLDATTRADLQRRYAELERRYQELLELYGMLRSRPEPEAHVILQRLRRSTDIHSTIAFIKEGDLLINRRIPASSSSTGETSAYPASAAARDDTSELGLRRRTVVELNPDENDTAMAEQIRHVKCLGLSHPVCDDRILRVKASRWTTVTANDNVLANLISLYLSWDHATMRLFDEDYFLDQIAAGQTEYCSPLLVNSLLATASLNYSAIDKEESKSMGHAFFREASRLWDSSADVANVLQVPSAILMSAWSNWNGDKDMGRFYVSQALQVASRTGLFQPLDWNSQPLDPPVRRHQKAIAVIAWGLFNFQTINGFFGLADVHRLGPPNFPVPYDAFSHEDDRSLWDPFPLIRPRQILHRGLIFTALSELSVILSDFLAGQDLSSSYDAYNNAKALHGKMLAWADNLPVELVRGPESLPAVLDIQYEISPPTRPRYRMA
ncbi:hypothetical protein F5Y17DRAFT_471455 [Xylariaceae sp. FL0594]|nr:hypothetical protein F5Y17DRAFT_471455 [Xylariaceae sp. FL0594]